MNRDELNRIGWAKAINDNIMLYPAENVARFLGRYYKNTADNKGRSALDIGFGSGRNLKILMDYGFDVYGIDYVDECVELVNGYFKNNPRLKAAVKGDFSTYDFKTRFDVIIIWGLLHFRTMTEIKRDLSVIYDMLNNGGKLLVNFPNKDHFLYKKGKEIEKNTYLLDYPSYKNLIYTFLDPDEFKDILTEAGFKILAMEREDYWKNNLTERFSWWIAALSKNYE